MLALATLLVALPLLVLWGCKVEHPPSREEKKEERLEAAAKKGLPPSLPPSVDDANLVLNACGRPAFDRVLAIYNRLDNGPIRRMIYAGRRPVTIDFLPSVPLARKIVESGPLPQRRLLPVLPAHSVWRFDEARVDKQEFLTTAHLGIYLPCAVRALQREY